MTEVFADTFYWLALLNVDDAYHEKVTHVEKPGRLVVTWAVQVEVLDALSTQRFRPLAQTFWQECRDDNNLSIVPLDESLLIRAMDLFTRRPDKDWSFTDCISFTIMEDRGITEALTADHHFEQAGFHCLLRE